MAQLKPEPWDYEAFVRHYNEFAREFSGYDFDPTGMPEEKLRGYYEAAPSGNRPAISPARASSWTSRSRDGG